MAPDESYEVKMCVEEAGVIVTSNKEPKASCTVTLTSPIMRDENTPEGGGNLYQTRITWIGPLAHIFTCISFEEHSHLHFCHV